METSKPSVLCSSRHAELVSASPENRGIAGQARNDEFTIRHERKEYRF